MNSIKYFITFAAVVFVAACSNKLEPSKSNFATPIKHYLEQAGQVCLGYTAWPTSAIVNANTPNPRAVQLLALEKAGLLKRDATSGKIFTEFSATEAAKPFMVEREKVMLRLGGMQRVKLKDICWARRELVSIDKWDQPIALGEYKEVSVYYTYKLVEVADWVKSPEFLAAFPQIDSLLSSLTELTANSTLKLTSEGWEALDLN